MTAPLPWERHLSVRQVGPSSRSGSSSPRVGAVHVERLEYEQCPDCGGCRIVGAVHAPRLSPGGVRDCVGRLVADWPKGGA